MLASEAALEIVDDRGEYNHGQVNCVRACWMWRLIRQRKGHGGKIDAKDCV